MTYHLSYDLKKIISPVSLVLPDGEKMVFPSGTEAAEYVFDFPGYVKSLRADNGAVEIQISKADISAVSSQCEIDEKNITASPFF